MATTFEIQADDYSNIALAVVTPEGPESTTLTNYQVNLASIRFHEEARIKFQYAQYQHREGGEVRDAAYPLVPVSFTGRVVGLGATPALRLADLAQKSADLMRVITNSNGYLKYKPDGLAAGVLDTYYRYIQSNPPRPLSGATEYWGRARASFEPTTYTEGIPTRQFEITLMTHPFALSDPTSPVEVLSATTLNNIGDGSNDHVTITNATVKGSVPAVTRIIAHPLTAGADAAIGTLWLAKRTSGLASFVADYFTSTALAPAGVWSTETDASRCNGEYYRCTPVANNLVYARRYTIANWSSHKGRAALMIVARNNGNQADDFDIYYRWSIANYPLTGEKKQLTQISYWEPLLLGEIDLPETEMSSQENLDLYIDICVERVGGSGTFDLDCLKLLFTDEAALQTDMPSGEGASTTHSFLLENFDEEIAHAIVHATDKLAYICNPYGDFITLEPDSDNRLDVAWKRYREVTAGFEDDFSEYGDFWRKIADFESGETWVFSAGSSTGVKTDIVVEGEQSIGGSGSSVIAYCDKALDLSDVADSSWFCIAAYASKYLTATATVEMRFYSTVSSDYYSSGALNIPVTLHGWKHVKQEKSLFTTVGSPSWKSIVRVEIRGVASAALTAFKFDDLRVSVADPDDPATYDDTNGVWDIQSGDWHIEELSGSGKTMGATLTVTWGNEMFVLLANDYGGNVQYRAKVQIRDAGHLADIWSEQAGIVFRCSDGTEGSEDCYVFQLYTTVNRVYLYSYTAGSRSEITNASYTCNTGEDYYLGVIAEGTSIRCFASTVLDSLWDDANKLIDTTDSDHSTGKCGLLARDGHGRFDDVKIEQLGDLHVPSDQLQLSAHALFRTIYPFYES